MKRSLFLFLSLALPLHVFSVILLVSLAFAQSDEVVPNENLVVEGIPKIPAALADTVMRYSEFRAASFTSWHPERREMLIATRFADTAQVHQVKTPGGARTQLTFFPDRVASAIYPPVNGNSFVFMKDVGGGEFFQLYRYDLANGDITLLTDGKSRNTDPHWSYQGDRIAFGSTRRDGNDVDIWVVNANDPGSARMIAQLDGGGWGVSDWSPDGTQLLVTNYVSAAESYVWLMEAASGKKELLTPKTGSETVAYSNARFAKDGKEIYLASDRDSEFKRLVVMELGSRKITVLTAALNWDVDEFDLSHDGRWIAFDANEDGISILHVLDTKTNKEVPVPKLPVGVIEGIEWRNNSREIAFSLSTASQPFDAYSVDMASGKIERWTFSETGGLNTSGFAQPQLIHWKSWDQQSISAFLYKPGTKFPGKRPVIISMHGGPEGQVRPDFLGRDDYYLNELGIAMIYPNVRGSTGYGKTFQKLDNGFLREGSYKDINSLLDWIQTQPDLDAGKVMITGGSYGGFMTLAVATNYNDRICCSVDVVGPSNLVTFLEHTSGYRQDLRRVEYGDERDPKMREFLERIAPANNARNITKPLFVIAGQNDPRVPASESAQMVQVVRTHGTPVWWLLAKDEGHGFGKKKNRDYQFYATVVFVKQYLLK
ncbi:MAG TPA: S9 family peptidase [Candidatus Acidoferrales bacterium]|jgi:dipeptidyl aminopeptidase/acylaminoacyl peptidase|nr:S9 family peptidase [Candidatus Acidoferrales bacterium]